MNTLILSLAPFGGLATALPAIAAADRESVAPQAFNPEREARSFALEAQTAGPAERDRDGGYLLL